MQKKLIALAVAAAAAAPAFAQSNVTIYGQMRVAANHTNSKVANSDVWQVQDAASRIGFKGSEDLGGGMKAIWQWESNLNNTQAGSDATGGYTGNQVAGTNIGQRNTFLGLSGNFGTVLAGTHDAPYKLGGSADLFADTAADAQCNSATANTANTTANGCIIGRNGFDNRFNNVLAYISPTWSGFHFAVAGTALEETGEATNRASGLTDGYSMVAVYDNGPLKATLGHEVRTAKYIGDTATETKATGTKLNIGYKMGAIGLGYTYESSTDTVGGVASRTKDKGHLASVSYGMGATTLGLQMGKFDDRNSGAETTDLKTWTVGAYHALSKRTQAYAAYHNAKFGGGNATGANVLSLGLNHSF